MIVALAGRRIDGPNAKTPRFPWDAVDRVCRRLSVAFLQDGATTLVCAAANGADLVALCAAAELHLSIHIVLPFEASEFRKRSVADRPGPWPWGDIYDELVAAAEASGDLHFAGLDPESQSVYEDGNLPILNEALRVGRDAGEGVCAYVVSDGPISDRAGTDYTQHFAERALELGIQVRSIGIIEASR